MWPSARDGRSRDGCVRDRGTQGVERDCGRTHRDHRAVLRPLPRVEPTHRDRPGRPPLRREVRRLRESCVDGGLARDGAGRAREAADDQAKAVERRGPRDLRGVQVRPRDQRRGLPLPERTAAHPPVLESRLVLRGSGVGPGDPSVPHGAGLRQLPVAHGRVRRVGGPVDREHEDRRREGRGAAAHRRRAHDPAARGATRRRPEAEHLLAADPELPGGPQRGGSPAADEGV